MKKYPINGTIKATLVAIEIYKLSLITNILIGAVMTPIAFFMGSDANPGNVSALSVGAGLLLMIIFWICTPLSLILNWYMIFSKKTEHPAWFYWLIPLPFVGLLGLSMIGLGLKPFIPFSFS